jgi:hypothetical protein
MKSPGSSRADTFGQPGHNVQVSPFGKGRNPIIDGLATDQEKLGYGNQGLSIIKAEKSNPTAEHLSILGASNLGLNQLALISFQKNTGHEVLEGLRPSKFNPTSSMSRNFLPPT